MINKIKLLLALSILGGLLAPLAFSQYVSYAELDSKYVYINAPAEYKEVGVALTETACERLLAVLQLKDKFEFQEALKAYDVLKIKNYTPAILVDLDLFANKAKVTILDGLQREFSGWIPIDWLKNNQDQPVLSESYQYVPYELSQESPIYEFPWGCK